MGELAEGDSSWSGPRAAYVLADSPLRSRQDADLCLANIADLARVTAPAIRHF
ncbi:hypothetical protein [Streptomyces chartreusis]|uniref:hypothetical protein n=1 Tax=Streptomyces chartreusis TaxID=1969 RepID=UPI00343A7C07